VWPRRVRSSFSSGRLTQALGLTVKSLAVVLLSFLASSCTTTTKSVERLGVRVGNHLVSHAEAVAISCEASKASDPVSFPYPSDALCFFDPAKAGILYPSTPRFASGSRFDVVDLKRVYLFDSEQFLIYVLPEGTQQVVIVRDFQFPSFLSVAKPSEP